MDDSRKPEIATWQILKVEIALRPGCHWEAILPCDQKSLEGMLKVMPFRKRQRDKFLEQAVNGQESQIAVTAALVGWEKEIEVKAGRILEELTRGTRHQGQDSPIPCDRRFKRTRQGNLFVGAGNILAAIKEAAFFITGNPGMKRSLGNRLYISPGKVVICRYNEWGARGLLKKADGRIENHVPPTVVMGPTGPRRKPATISFPEIVEFPACLHFYLHIAPDTAVGDIEQYLEVGGELGLMGRHSGRVGQFNVQLREPTGAESKSFNPTF